MRSNEWGMRSNEWRARVLAAATVVTVAVAGVAVWRGFATDAASAGPAATETGIDVTDAIPIEIRDFAFGPQTVTVSAGSVVEWTNTDQVAHSVRSEDGAFTEQTMDGGGTASAKLDRAGTYAYVCGIHPAMTGTIEVTP